MVVNTVVHFEIPAKNSKKLSAFYTQVFGWKIIDSGMPGMQYWLISTGPKGKSIRGGMYQRRSVKDGPRNFIAVDKIGAAIRTFKAAGGKEISPKSEIPGVGWSFIGKDPEGNLIGLFEAARRRGGS